MTIGEHISNIRARIGTRGYDDDSVLTDEYLYSQLNLASAIVISRVANSFNKLNDFLFTRWPVPLTPVNKDLFSCEDIPDRCVVLESNWTIPLPLTARNKIFLKVYSDKELVQGHPSITQHDPIKANEPTWDIVNGKLRVYGTKTLRAVEVKGIFLNPLSWKDKNYCGTEEYDCLDLNEEFYSLTEPRYQMMAYDIVLQGLGIPLQEDTKNNAH